MEKLKKVTFRAPLCKLKILPIGLQGTLRIPSNSSKLLKVFMRSTLALILPTLDNGTLTLALKLENFSRLPLKTVELFGEGCL